MIDREIKTYIDGQIAIAGGGGSGDMLKSVYDSNNDGVIAKPQLDASLANTSGTNTGDNATNSQYSGDYRPSGTDVAIADGGTGASTASGARTNLGIPEERSKIYRSTAQTISNAIWTKIQLNTQAYNSGCTVDIVTNYRITIITAGRYQINCSVALNIANTAKQFSLALRKNGTDAGYFQDWTTTTTTVPFCQVNDILDLAANDYLELWVYHNDGANADIYASGNDYFNFLSIHRLS